MTYGDSMKKKIAILLLLVLVMTFAFAGCNMVTLDKEVDNNLVIANISYKGLTETVTKKELNDMFNTQGQLYIYYYGWSKERTYDFCADALAQQKLAKLKALDELCAMHNEKFPNDKLDPASIKVVDLLSFAEGTKPSFKNIYSDILYVDERINILESYNKQINDAIDSIVKELEKEEELNKPEEDKPEGEEDKEEPKEEIDKPAIREPRPEEDKKPDDIKSDDERKEEGTFDDRVTKLNGIKKFEIQWNIDKNEEQSKIDADKVAAGNDKDKLKEVEERQAKLNRKVKALTELDKRLKKNGKSRDSLFEELINNMVVAHYRLVVVNNNKVAIDNTVNNADSTKKDEIIKSNKTDFIISNITSNGRVDKFLPEKYEAAVKGEKPVYYHPIVNDPEKELGSAGFGFTFNILLNFNKNDAEILKQLKSKADQTGATVDMDLYESKKLEFAKRIKVNISNPNYKPDGECASGISKADLDKKNANGEYMYKDKYGYHKCDKVDCPLKPFGYDVKDSYGALLSAEEVKLIAEGYDVPVLTILKMINYDLSKIQKDTTITNPYDKQVKLREEFTKWIYKVNDDPGMFSNENARGYMVPKMGKSSFVDSYTDQARKLMGGVITDNKVTYANPTYAQGNKHFVGNYYTSEIKETATFENFMPMMAISEFGIHIIMISEMPGYYQDSNHILLDDAPFSYGRDSYTFVADSFKDEVRKYEESKVYEAEVTDLVKNYDKYVKLDKKKYESLYKD